MDTNTIYLIVGIMTGFYLLDKFDDKVQSKIQREEELTGVEKMFINNVAPLINLFSRSYPFIVVGLLLMHISNKQ